MDPNSLSTRCGIILAGGEGRRLQSHIRKIIGKNLPKQYVDFIGTGSLLEHTFQRVTKLISPEYLFTVVGRNHLGHHEVSQQLDNRPKGSAVILQPENKETGPGVLLPLIHLYKYDPRSTVAIFPSDHFILEEELFLDHVETAFQVAEQSPGLLVLMGIAPLTPEPDYGYIVPGQSFHQEFSELRRVTRFVEKPDASFARELIRNGGLWNTSVLVCQTGTLLDLIRIVSPVLYASFQWIGKHLGTSHERIFVEAAYRNIQPVNFSKDILERLANRFESRMAVLEVNGVFWSDVGSERRVVNDLQKWGCLKEGVLK